MFCDPSQSISRHSAHIMPVFQWYAHALKYTSLWARSTKNPRWKYWATRSSVYLFARTAHSFACSALLAKLTRSIAPTRSLARSLPSSGHSDWLDGYLSHSGPKCTHIPVLFRLNTPVCTAFATASLCLHVCPRLASESNRQPLVPYRHLSSGLCHCF